MHDFTAIVTAALLAIHAALGCCWHHGHAHGSTGGQAAAREHSCPHGQCDGHRGHGHGEQGHRHDAELPDENAPDEDGPCGGACDEGACVFLAGGKPVTPDPGGAALPGGILSAASSDAAYSLAAIGTNHVPLALPPPLRLHLAKRLLLI